MAHACSMSACTAVPKSPLSQTATPRQSWPLAPSTRRSSLVARPTDFKTTDGSRLVLTRALITVRDNAPIEGLLNQSAGKLVVVQFAGPDVCESGQNDNGFDLSQCTELKKNLEAIAAECPDVDFIDVDVATKSDPLCLQWGVTTLPSLQFFSGKVKVFQHNGYHKLKEELGEGVLYYGNAAANNERVTDTVLDLNTKDDLNAFVNAQPEEVLAVVDVSTYMCEPCMHVYPAVMQLAKSLSGFATFARLIGEEDGQFENLLAELNIVEVPTFLFYKGGKEVGRHIGDTRELIMQIIQTQQNFGVAPPVPAHRRRAGTKGARPAKPMAKRNLWKGSTVL